MLTPVVVRKRDGTLIKGVTGDFLPFRRSFHLQVDRSSSPLIEVTFEDIKAVFFVKSLAGNRGVHDALKRAGPRSPEAPGRKVVVVFEDGEKLEGTTSGYHLDRTGFFLAPRSRADNNERVFVVRAALRKLKVDGHEEDLAAAGLSRVECPACGRSMESAWRYCPFDGTTLAGRAPRG